MSLNDHKIIVGSINTKIEEDPTLGPNGTAVVTKINSLIDELNGLLTTLVDLTSNQNIGGNKSFTSNVSIAGNLNVDGTLAASNLVGVNTGDEVKATPSIPGIVKIFSSSSDPVVYSQKDCDALFISESDIGTKLVPIENGKVPASYIPDITCSYDDLTNVPLSFPSNPHTHSYIDLEDVPTAFPPATHTHSYLSLTDIPTDFQPVEHNHSWADINNSPSIPSSTDDIEEGTNLYWTQDRFDAAFLASDGATNSSLNSSILNHLSEADPHSQYILRSESSGFATAAQGLLANTAVQPEALSSKADLVDGIVPLSQLPPLGEGTGNVSSVNGQIGNVVLTAEDVEAAPLDGTNKIPIIYIPNIPYSKLDNLPTSFTPDDHEHLWGDISNPPFIPSTTTDIAEGSNLYWTEARFNNSFSAKTPGDLGAATPSDITTQLTNHTDSVDPHNQYVLKSSIGTAAQQDISYFAVPADLDAKADLVSGKVPSHQLPEASENITGLQLQRKRVTTSTTINLTTSWFTGMIISFTPLRSNSYIDINIYSQCNCHDNGIDIRLRRLVDGNLTTIYSPGNKLNASSGWVVYSPSNIHLPVNLNYVDYPNQETEFFYYVEFRAYLGTGTAIVNYDTSYSNATSHIELREISRKVI